MYNEKDSIIKTSELMPCPFCGAAGAKTVPGGGYWKIKCDCGITVSGYSTRKDAVFAWNKRPDDDNSNQVRLTPMYVESNEFATYVYPFATYVYPFASTREDAAMQSRLVVPIDGERVIFFSDHWTPEEALKYLAQLQAGFSKAFEIQGKMQAKITATQPPS